MAQDAALFADIDERWRPTGSTLTSRAWSGASSSDGRLVHVKGAGVQDLEAKRPVTPETLFRIASMTKAFTALSILKLRDEGKLSLDAPVETYVPELRGWTLPDRRLAEDPRPRPADPHRRLRHRRSVGRSADAAARGRVHPPAARGRAVHARARPGDGVLEPRLRAARPHHHERLRSSPTRTSSAALLLDAAGHGVDRLRRRLPRRRSAAPSAIAGKTTPGSSSRRWRTARSARWAGCRPAPPTTRSGWLSCSSAWPARDGADAGPVRRVERARAVARARNFAGDARAAGHERRDGLPRRPSTYAMGFYAAIDCDLGLTLSHGGGYPGYGSHVLLLPDYGVGIFAFANRTYAGPRPPVWDAAVRAARRRAADAAADRRCRRRSPRPTPRSAQDFAAGSVDRRRRRAGDELA